MTNKGRQSKGKGVASSSSGPIAARPPAARSTAVVRPTTDQVMTDPSPTPTGSTADTPPQSSPAHTGSNSELPPSTSSLADASSTNKMIHLELEDGSFIPGHTAASQITKIFKDILDRKGYIWKEVSQQTKEFYWLEFKKYFVFDTMPERLIKEAWRKKASKCYSQLLYEFRRDGKPECFSKESWICWVKFWNSSEFKKKSDQASTNRRSEVDGPGSGLSFHTCGSKSAKEHARDLALVFLLALIVRAANRPSDYDSDKEYIGGPRQQIRQPLINRPAAPANGVSVAGTLDQRPSRNDAWSARMRDKVTSMKTSSNGWK